MLNSADMASCVVSFLDTEGLRHTVEVEIRSSVTHTVTPKKVREWLNGGAKTPKDAVMKERLRSLL